MLDTHTFKLCQDMDGKVFAMKDFHPGVITPPFHVFYRSTTLPYFEDNFDMSGERTVVDEDGDLIFQAMSYSEWKERFVDDDVTEGKRLRMMEYLDTIWHNLTKGNTEAGDGASGCFCFRIRI